MFTTNNGKITNHNKIKVKVKPSTYKLFAKK